MQIVLYYDNQLIAKKIKKQVQAMKVDETKVLHIDKLTCDELKAAHYIYVEWGLADFLLKNYWGIITDKPVGFYNDSSGYSGDCRIGMFHCWRYFSHLGDCGHYSYYRCNNFCGVGWVNK